MMDKRIEQEYGGSHLRFSDASSLPVPRCRRAPSWCLEDVMRVTDTLQLSSGRVAGQQREVLIETAFVGTAPAREGTLHGSLLSWNVACRVQTAAGWDAADIEGAVIANLHTRELHLLVTHSGQHPHLPVAELWDSTSPT